MKQLKNLVESDKENMRKVAIYNGFFNCVIHPSIIQTNDLNVVFHVELGPRYSLKNIDITWLDRKSVLERCPPDLQPTLIDLEPSRSDIETFSPGRPAEGDLLLSFEKEIVKSLQSKGFIFASVVDKKFIAFPHTAMVDVHFEIKTGPLVRLGEVTIEGMNDVKDSYIRTRLMWKRGEFYNTEKIEQTETRLLKSGLFQSVVIDCKVPQGTETLLSSGDEVPVTLTVSESKHKTVGAGVSYTTTLGGGTSLEWEHRNIRGIGERLSFRAELWQKMRSITLTYALPQWKRSDRLTSIILEHDHQIYLPYHSTAYKASVLREQTLKRQGIEFVWGGRVEKLHSTRATGNKHNILLKAPLQFKWTSANSQLDPTSGMTMNLKITPSYQFVTPQFSYLISQFTWSTYDTFFDNSTTLATRFSCGSVSGRSTLNIPIPDRFFGGSENSLRGYKTGSVSPVDSNNEPAGGRSIVTATLELRNRYKNGFGSVFFYDTGNVFNEPLPSFELRRILHSVGGGIRYNTPIGPLRLDIAFPLNRRKGIDPPFQIYFSIGQAF